MPVIDFSSNVGKLRLRLGDALDIQIYPDAVYESALAECDNNLPRATKLMAQYILAALSMRVHERMGGLEVYGNNYYSQYADFLQRTILNPHLMTDVPIPYAGGLNETHPIIQFQQNWNAAYVEGTESQELQDIASATGTTRIF